MSNLDLSQITSFFRSWPEPGLQAAAGLAMLEAHESQPKGNQMHELSIVQSMLQGLAQESAQFGPGRISEIRLQVGAASGVSLEALQFAFEAASPHSIAAGALLQIDLIPLTIQCTTCLRQQNMDHLSLVCPVCGSPANLISGRELLIKSYTFEEEDNPQILL